MTRSIPSIGWIAIVALGLTACAPAAPPSPTAAPAKPAATTAPAKPAEAPKPVAKPTEAAKPAAPAPAKPVEAKPAASPAAKGEAKPVASPAAKPAAQPADNFFAGKTIRIITGYTPGGQYDAWSRLHAKYMPKYIPGNPTMVVENMAGAASQIAANHVYKSAPKDGTVIGNIGQALILSQIIGTQGIEFDMQQFQWLGAVTNVTPACLTRDETGVKTLADMMPPSSKQVISGTSGPGSTGYDYPLLMQRVLDANWKIVSGYPGNNEVRLSIEKGEVDGYCVPWEVLKPTLRPWIETGQPKFTLFVQVPQEGSKHPEMADVPVIWDFIKNSEDKVMFKMLQGPEQFFWPFMVPPGVPADRVQVLRDALAKSFKDPELMADATRANFTMNPVPGDKIQQLIKDILATPEPVKARFKELMKPIT